MSKFPCQNCGHAVIVTKTKMNSADDNSVVATCRKCGQTVTHDDVISYAQGVGGRMMLIAETRAKAK